MRKLARLSLAIGGFLIVTSLILTGIIFLILLDLIELEVFADPAINSVLMMNNAGYTMSSLFLRLLRH